MTIGATTPSRRSLLSDNCIHRLKQDDDDIDPSLLSKQKSLAMKAANALNASIARQVSHDGGQLTISIVETEGAAAKASGGGPVSPVRCVSEFDKVANGQLDVESTSTSTSSSSSSSNGESASVEQAEFTSLSTTPTAAATTSSAPGPSPFPNPLHNPELYQAHVRAVRLEAELHPMRLILSRLMHHTSLNRKGVFNSPVDPLALGLPDYFQVIERPMDFGTIKVKLHAIAYTSREEVDEEIRLVFRNALTYNPPNNTVHLAARALLEFYEGQCEAFAPELVKSDDAMHVAAPSSDLQQSHSLMPSTTVAPAFTEAQAPTTLAALSEGSDSQCSVLPCSSIPPPTISSSLSAALPVQTHAATTGKNFAGASLPLASIAPTRKRKKRGSRTHVSHACDRCEGRTCSICLQGCLTLEPTLLICNGAQCAGSRINKGSIYFIAKDGSRQFCQRCHTSLPAVLPLTGQEDVVRYKRDLLKRKNDEEIAERWLQCSVCESPVHQMCVMHDEYVHSEEGYACPSCVQSTLPPPKEANSFATSGELYTFVCGSEVPVKLSDVTGGVSVPLSADALPETDISSFIQRKVREQMAASNVPNVEKTVVVRIISDCDRYFMVPDVIRKHFRMVAHGSDVEAAPPSRVDYRSKAVALFQKIDGLDVCIFCMYVHEYDDQAQSENAQEAAIYQKKRVYIAYLDSVEHFRPRTCRTNVYQEILVAYLATARKRGYLTAHIWACPPSRGNSFVFWNHPASQRTPNKDRLVAWYHSALSRAVECGVVTDVKSLFESDFEQQLREMKRSGGPVRSIICPPLLDGDFWIEEAVRIHRLNMSRQMKPRIGDTDLAPVTAEGLNDRCPAMQVAALLRDRIIAHPSALPFRKPVNAVALKLKDYHQVITKPMDLGSVYSRCVLGEFLTLADLVSDVELVFANAKRYNPKGHIVHANAIEVSELFFQELNDLVVSWNGNLDQNGMAKLTWASFSSVSMSLDESRFSPAVDAIQDIDCDDVSGSLDVAGDLLRRDGEVDLLTGGAAAIELRMVGNDTWLLEKNMSKSKADPGKTSDCRRRKNTAEPEEEPASKRRRQGWLSTEVGDSVRRMRASFFTCSLAPKAELIEGEAGKADMFSVYVNAFSPSRGQPPRHAKIADVRHALMEFSQFRNLEFDTVRHSKYSTAVILYHLHSDDGIGIVPSCSTCGISNYGDVRWHKLCKITERRINNYAKAVSTKPSFHSEELCSPCYLKHSHKENFIPVQVSLSPCK